MKKQRDKPQKSSVPEQQIHCLCKPEAKIKYNYSSDDPEIFGFKYTEQEPEMHHQHI